MTIAKKHAQSYMPNGEVSLEQVIQAAIDEAAKSHGPSPDPVKLAEHYEQRIRQLEAERVPDGHIVVKAKWVERNSGLGDHACARCYPHSDMIVDGFTCYYHQAVDMLAAAPAQEKV